MASDFESVPNSIDLRQLREAWEPSETVKVDEPSKRQYYIDFHAVRSGKRKRAITERLKYDISLAPDSPTCQLFTGHVGSGKSTELLKLKADLNAEDFHVVYIESSERLEMSDIDITDILISIASSIVLSLQDEGIELQKGNVSQWLMDIKEFFLTSEVTEISIAGLAAIGTRAKASKDLRRQLRQQLEPRTSGVLESLNRDVIEFGNSMLKSKGKKGLAVLIDGLDRVDNRNLGNGRSQQEYIFVERAEQLRRLNCHIVYTIPLDLMFSKALEQVCDRFGTEPLLLPMVAVKKRDGCVEIEGIKLLRQMILARAFPNSTQHRRMERIGEIFDSVETLDRICQVSGGHARNLLRLVSGCLIEERKLPITRESAEIVIKARSKSLLFTVTTTQWEFLRKVEEEKTVNGEEGYRDLMRSMFIYEYLDDDGPWFDINPLFLESR